MVRKQNNSIKRGVVFINETVPYKAVAWLANKLYHENYTSIPTKHAWDFKEKTNNITYQWLLNKQWQSISVETNKKNEPIIANSFEEFIFDHYYGYAKVNSEKTEEYEVVHQKWETQTVLNYHINCDFEKMYGYPFKFLNEAKPLLVFITEGSNVAIKWKRSTL